MVRVALAIFWLGTAPLVIALVAAFVFPLDLSGHGRTYLNLAWAAFMARTFSFHAAGVLVLLAVGALALRAPRLGLLGVAGAGFAAVLGGVAPGGASVPRDAPSAGRSLTVMTCNLWAGLTDASRIVAEVRRCDADVIVFQEYTPLLDGQLRAALGGAYPFVEADAQRDFSGMATYSRLPMRRIAGRLLGPRGVAPMDPVHWERQLCCVVEMDAGTEGTAGREILVQNIHLPTAPMGRSLLRQHHRLIREIRDWLAEEQRPVIMAGDFNCTPMSAEAGAIRGMGMVDAHRAAGGGLGASWGRTVAWPGFRIDHVYSRGLRPVSCAVGAEVGSDHRPVIARLALD